MQPTLSESLGAWQTIYRQVLTTIQASGLACTKWGSMDPLGRKSEYVKQGILSKCRAHWASAQASHIQARTSTLRAFIFFAISILWCKSHTCAILKPHRDDDLYRTVMASNLQSESFRNKPAEASLSKEVVTLGGIRLKVKYSLAESSVNERIVLETPGGTRAQIVPSSCTSSSGNWRVCAIDNILEK